MSVYAQEFVRIGGLFDLSGPASNIGKPSKLVAEMAVDIVNKEGGFYGREIEFVTMDTKGDPKKASTNTKKMIFRSKVLALVGPTRTGCGNTIKSIVHRSKVPTIMLVGGDSVVTDDDEAPAFYIYKTPQRSSTAIKRILTYLKDKKKLKIGLLSGNDFFGKDGRDTISKLAPEFGIQIIAKEECKPEDTDLTDVLTKINKDKPDAIVCWTIGPASPNASICADKLGLTNSIIQCHGVPGPEYIEQAGKSAEGDLMPTTKLLVVDDLPDTDPQKKVIQNFVHLYKDVYHLDKKFPLNTHSGYAWDAIQLIVYTMKKVGLETDEIREELENTNKYVGVSGIFNFSATDHNGLDIDSMIMVEVKNGKFVIAK